MFLADTVHTLDLGVAAHVCGAIMCEVMENLDGARPKRHVLLLWRESSRLTMYVRRRGAGSLESSRAAESRNLVIGPSFGGKQLKHVAWCILLPSSPGSTTLGQSTTGFAKVSRTPS